jgi:hypothetical protein
MPFNRYSGRSEKRCVLFGGYAKTSSGRSLLEMHCAPEVSPLSAPMHAGISYRVCAPEPTRVPLKGGVSLEVKLRAMLYAALSAVVQVIASLEYA